MSDELRTVVGLACLGFAAAAIVGASIEFWRAFWRKL
jgi:hypothetical protein